MRIEHTNGRITTARLDLKSRRPTRTDPPPYQFIAYRVYNPHRALSNKAPVMTKNGTNWVSCLGKAGLYPATNNRSGARIYLQ